MLLLGARPSSVCSVNSMGTLCPDACIIAHTLPFKMQCDLVPNHFLWERSPTSYLFRGSCRHSEMTRPNQIYIFLCFPLAIPHILFIWVNLRIDFHCRMRMRFSLWTITVCRRERGTGLRVQPIVSVTLISMLFALGIKFYHCLKWGTFLYLKAYYKFFMSR